MLFRSGLLGIGKDQRTGPQNLHSICGDFVGPKVKGQPVRILRNAVKEAVSQDAGVGGVLGGVVRRASPKTAPVLQVPGKPFLALGGFSRKQEDPLFF